MTGTYLSMLKLWKRQSEPAETLSCKMTGNEFTVSGEEVAAYKEFDLPLPRLCPEERLRRQLAFRNERRFFWRPCSHSGKRIYSTFAPNTPFPVYDISTWWSDEWDAMSFEQEYDPKKPFFDQLYELWSKVPRPASSVRNIFDAQAVQYGRDVSNSFLVFNAYHVERCYYSHHIWECEDCSDCYDVHKSKLCYECIACHRCERLRFSAQCHSCSDSSFLFNCVECKNCLFCSNLEGKEHYVFNQPVSPEEYAATLENWSLTTRPGVESALDRFSEYLQHQPVPHILTDDADYTTGNYLYGCKRTADSFQCMDSSNLINCNGLVRADGCVDGYGFGDGLKNSAQFISVGANAENIVNCVECWSNVSDLTYCSYCEESSHLFGCVGVRGKQYCILNKQYSKADYEQLCAEIKQQLKDKRIWGLFFPANFSGYAYNHSSANDYMPLGKIQAEMMNFLWDEDDDVVRPSQLLGGTDLSPQERFAEVPGRLDDLDASTARQAVYLCEMTGRPFQLTEEEITFYHRVKVAPPTRSFEQRHRERLARVAPKKMNTRKSDKSGKEIRTSFPENWRQPVYEYREWKKQVLENSK